MQSPPKRGRKTSRTSVRVPTVRAAAAAWIGPAAQAFQKGIRTGDIVQHYPGPAVYNSRVSGNIIVPPDDPRVPRSDQASIVTLINCTYDLHSRLVVIGTLV